MGFRGWREIKVNRDRSEKFCYNEHENRVGAGKGCGTQLLPGRGGDKLQYVCDTLEMI